MFDFANSSYTTVVITAIYSGFFITRIIPPESTVRDTWWSAAMAGSTLLALVLSPLAGAICDKSGKKKSYLLGSAVVCSVSTAGLFLVGPGDVLTGVLLLVVSNAAFMLSESFCASFLPEIATAKNMGKISGFGWGLGYLGGIASLALVYAITSGSKGLEEIRSTQWAMAAVAAFFLIACLPTLLILRDRSQPVAGFEHAGQSQLFRAGWEEVRRTAKTLGRKSVLFRFLCAFTVYMAGLDVIIKFVGIYVQTELNFQQMDLILLFVILQISAASGALIFGLIEAQIGAKNAVLSSLALWILCILLIYFLHPLAGVSGWNEKHLFLLIALLAGSALGSTQSSSRTIVGLLTPAGKSAEVFGYWGMFTRIGSILGASFGLVSDALSRHIALLLVFLFFITGAILLYFIPINRSCEGDRSSL